MLRCPQVPARVRAGQLWRWRACGWLRPSATLSVPDSLLLPQAPAEPPVVPKDTPAGAWRREGGCPRWGSLQR